MYKAIIEALCLINILFPICGYGLLMLQGSYKISIEVDAFFLPLLSLCI